MLGEACHESLGRPCHHKITREGRGTTVGAHRHQPAGARKEKRRERTACRRDFRTGGVGDCPDDAFSEW